MSTQSSPKLPNLVNININQIRLLLCGVVGLLLSDWECILHAYADYLYFWKVRRGKKVPWIKLNQAAIIRINKRQFYFQKEGNE